MSAAAVNASPSSAGAADTRAALLRQASVEISPRDINAPKTLREKLPSGSRVNVTFLPNIDYRATVTACAALAKEGFTPAPHIAARSLRGRGELSDYLARLSDAAGVKNVLLIGGDLDTPRGPYRDCLSVLETGELQKHGVTSVAFAGHPEGHPAIAENIMREALCAKVAFAARNDLTASIVTQLCFEAAPILRWVRDIRALGIDAPIAVGAAAPANAAMMMKFALRCGVGPSIRALAMQTARIGRILTDSGPEILIDALAEALADDPTGALRSIAGIHFFVFGSVARAASWLATQRERVATAP